MADRRDAELLCLHLLSNALHASREGGSVCIALRRTESGWQLTVTDDGCGLPGEDVQAALENRRSFLGGAQLGLLLCRECCRRMDWSLQLEPAPEKGTQAVVRIPLYTAKAAPMAQWSCAPARRPSRSSASIICVPCWCGRCAPCPERGDPGRRILIRWQGRCTAFCAAALLFCARCFPASAKHGILNAENKSLEEQQ